VERGGDAGGPRIVPHRTVLATDAFALTITGEPGLRPAAPLGGRPTRSFADTWARLPAVPFDADVGRQWRVLDAQLRRIRSWSTALQFIEDYVDAYAPDVRVAVDGAGGDA
jgi:hypothetical protein